MFFKIGVCKNFANFTGKHLWCSLQRRFFPVKLAKFLRKPFLKEHLQWLLLYILYTHDVITDIIISIKRSVKAKTF